MVSGSLRLGRMSYTETDVERLGERLAAIDLDQGERAALDALMTFAARTPTEIEALASGDCPNRYKTVLPEILFDSEPAQP